MKQIKAEKFLDKYKELENTLRNHMENITMIAYEELLKNNGQTIESDKLRYLRTMRNLIVHVPEMKDFVCVCEEHIDFMNEIIFKIESVDGIVKDQYQTIAKSGALSLASDTLLTASENFISKNKSILPVVDFDKNKVWYVSDRDVIAFIVDGGKASTKLSKYLDRMDEFINPLENGVSYALPLNKVPEHTKPIPVVKGNKIVGFI